MIVEKWHSDIVISDQIVQRVIEAQFPELKSVKLKCIGEGWDNKAFLINDQYIFRFPHRKVSASLIERENAVLKNLHDQIDLQLPELLYIGNPSRDYPYHFHGYTMIDGDSACDLQLTEKIQFESINIIANFLKQLHSIGEDMAYAMGAKQQVFNRVDVARTISHLKERVEKIQVGGIATIRQTIFDAEIHQAKAVQLPDQKVLIHGDLHSRHLIFNKDKLVGIIDWGDVGVNSPAVDLAVVFSFYPQEYHQHFFDIYGYVDDDTKKYARFLALYIAVTFMLYAYDMQDSLLFNEAKQSITRISPDLLY